MGLDIQFRTNPDIRTDEYLTDIGIDFLHKHNLSRTFCNFMSREAVISHEPEFNQIGKLTSIDISVILDMQCNLDDEELEYRLGTADSEEEKQELIALAAKEKEKVKGNIEKVRQTVIALMDKLSVVNNLPQLLIPTDEDTLDNESYFANFNADIGDGYIGNNFGQDLRNFKRFLDYATKHSANTVWFVYG